MVGFATVFQHIPFSVIGLPPSEEIFPPDRAEEILILLIEIVEMMGGVVSNKSFLH